MGETTMFVDIPWYLQGAESFQGFLRWCEKRTSGELSETGFLGGAGPRFRPSAVLQWQRFRAAALAPMSRQPWLLPYSG